MRNNTTIFDIFQTLLTKEEVITVCEAFRKSKISFRLAQHFYNNCINSISF